MAPRKEPGPPEDGELSDDEPLDFHNYMEQLEDHADELTDPQRLDCLLGALRECWNVQVNIRRQLDALAVAIVGEQAWNSIEETVLDVEDEFHMDEDRYRQEGYAELPDMKVGEIVQALGNGNADLPVLLAKIVELARTRAERQ